MRTNLSGHVTMCALGWLLVMGPSPTGAATRHVPSEYSTIAAGLAASFAGDTVLVSCGTYHEYNLNLRPGVTLRSESGQFDCVTIDAQGLGRVLRCAGADAATRIIGITLHAGEAGYGGGFYGEGASPSFLACAFTDNLAMFEGGGIYCTGSSPALGDCVFSRNHAGLNGGALLAHDSSAGLRNCRFESNTADIAGGAVATFVNSGIDATNCRFVSNLAGDAETWGDGGAVYLDTSSGTLAGCVFAGNAAMQGGAVACSDASPLLVNCTLAGNSGPDGSAVWCARSSPALDQVIIANGLVGAGVYCALEGSLTVSCSDIVGNAGGDWVGCIAGQAGVNGNFSADPRFCDAALGDYALEPGSPCLPGFHPYGHDCGTIGALGEGCLATGVAERPPVPATWGTMKGLFRR